MLLSLELSLFLCVLLLLSISTNGQKPTEEDNNNNWQVVSNETKVMEQGGAAEEGGKKRVVKRIKVTRRRIVGGGTEQESGSGTRPAPETEAATLQPTSNATENAGNGTDPVRTVIDWRDQRSSRICGEGNGEWHFFDGFCYQLLTGSFGWDEALAECQNRSASLASIHSKQENHFVAALSTKFEQNFDDFCHGFWIGMTRKVADKDRELFECLWADGTAVGFGNAPRHSQYFMPPWRGGEPDNAGGKEECVQQYPWLGCDGQPQIFYAQWNDFSCSSKLNGAVCKKRVPITRGP